MSASRPGGLVVTLGEVLVELMARERGEDGFSRPLSLTGPFPSGAPAIFIDQVARLGQPCAIAACVGDDDFGRLNVRRLAADGVGTAAVTVSTGLPTGTAFVRYRPDGGRDFVHNIAASAAGALVLGDAAYDLLDRCTHLHISGSSLSVPALAQLAEQAVARAKSHGATVSFDPNLRAGVLTGSSDSPLRRVLDAADIVLPGEDELALLDGGDSEEEIAERLVSRGASHVVVKKGRQGAVCYSRTGRTEMAALPVEEVDPTGAGDCFAAAFVTCLVQGRGDAEALAYAVAAGARAVTRQGPMEGTSTFAELDALREGPGAGPRAAYGDGRRPVARPASTRARLRSGATSVCSGHPLVIQAAVDHALEEGGAVLIEATCNQVNHRGGYTGLLPHAFRESVLQVARDAGLAEERVILGGDHLGPSPWRELPAEQAMDEAALTVDAYVRAGYEKIHIDTSMGCQGEPAQLGDEVVAARAARLVAVAERAAAEVGASPLYVIGTEVPTPGGAHHAIERLAPTTPEAVLATVEAHREAFGRQGVADAFERVVAVVAQPGVEFDLAKVVVYDPSLAASLVAARPQLEGLVFEAHSTDYQPEPALASLVRDGFSILKVGPGLTYALREALYGLDHIARALGRPADESLIAAMEAEMLARPGYWEAYYTGSPAERYVWRHFSYSDRIRYYWPAAGPKQALEDLFGFFGDRELEEVLVSQYLPRVADRVAGGAVRPLARVLALQAVRDVLGRYSAAVVEGSRP